MRVIIAGSREFNDYNVVKMTMDAFCLQYGKYYDFQIVSGGARGADRLGERYAIEHNMELKRFPANWDLYGKRAGYIRNEEMAKNSDMLLAFWDGQSRGTKNMIEEGEKKNLIVHIYNYKEKRFVK